MSWSTCWLAATWPWLPIPALPLGVSIAIRTRRLEGWIDLQTGEVDLQFGSTFAARLAGGLWTTQPLEVDARMASGEQEGRVFHAVGEKLQGAHATYVIQLFAVYGP